jgi:uncharacterized protein (DUF362 family)
MNQAFQSLNVEFKGNILIKPNLCSKRRYPISTDVSIMSTLLTFMDNQKVIIVESNNHDTTAWERFKANGFLVFEEYKNVSLINISENPEILTKNYDLTISLANLKSHSWERYTGVCKNMYGCLPIKHKERYHPFFKETLSSLFDKIEPNLCIIDGRIGLESWGPVVGKKISLDTMIIGNDPVETDFVACSLIGIDPYQVPHLKELSKKRNIIINNKPKIHFKKPLELSVKMMQLGLLLGKHRMVRAGTMMYIIGSILGGSGSKRKKRVQKFQKTMRKHLYQIIKGTWFL